MKYKVEQVKETFKPITVTLTIETEEEAIKFYDEIMCKITGVNQHPFHGAVYQARRNKRIIHPEGKI